MNNPNESAPNSTVPNKPIGLAIVGGVILIFVFMQIAGLFSSGQAQHSSRLSGKVVGEMDDEATEDLYSSSLYAKLAFLGARQGTVYPEPGYLQQALDASEDLEYSQPDSPGIARRVIVLRLLLNRPAFQAIKHKGDPFQAKPVDAFTKSLPKTLSPIEKKQYVDEITAWIAADSKIKMSPAQLSEVVHVISTVPGIGWWKSACLMEIYSSQGNKALTSTYFASAQHEALNSMLPFVFAIPVVVCMVLAGVFLLVFLIGRATSDPQTSPVATFNPWPTVPPLINDTDRKLDAIILWGIFILYMAMQLVVSTALVGFTGTGLFWWLHFGGLLTSRLPAIQREPMATHMLIVVSVEAGAYIVAALVPMITLVIIARVKGASLANELGWHTRNLKKNLLFGVLGYCAGLPLLFLAGIVGKTIFKGAPEPTNPAITLLTNSSSNVAQAMMVGLAIICAPFFEEFFFRGVFYQGARQLFGPIPAIIMTGLIFGLVHPVGAEGMLAIAVLGGVLAWVAESRKSLASTMIGHFLQNVGASMAVILLVSR